MEPHERHASGAPGLHHGTLIKQHDEVATRLQHGCGDVVQVLGRPAAALEPEVAIGAREGGRGAVVIITAGRRRQPVPPQVEAVDVPGKVR